MRTMSMEELTAALEAVRLEIGRHPYNSPPLKENRRIVESMRGRERREVQRELSARGLPPLEHAGRTMLRGLWSFWGLHHRRRLLEREIERRGGTASAA